MHDLINRLDVKTDNDKKIIRKSEANSLISYQSSKVRGYL